VRETERGLQPRPCCDQKNRPPREQPATTLTRNNEARPGTRRLAASPQPAPAGHAFVFRLFIRCSDSWRALRWGCFARERAPDCPTGIVPAGSWRSTEQSVLPTVQHLIGFLLSFWLLFVARVCF